MPCGPAPTAIDSVRRPCHETTATRPLPWTATSTAGAFLDSVLDRLADAALLAGLALAAGLDTSTWAALAAALFGSL